MPDQVSRPAFAGAKAGEGVIETPPPGEAAGRESPANHDKGTLTDAARKEKGMQMSNEITKARTDLFAPVSFGGGGDSGGGGSSNFDFGGWACSGGVQDTMTGFWGGVGAVAGSAFGPAGTVAGGIAGGTFGSMSGYSVESQVCGMFGR